jgi:diadenosine tetraphosphate (Ap4A) HIT family hydrolase
LLPGGSPHLHVHISARRRGGKTWAQPVDLPKAPGAFGFEPLSEAERTRLADALTETLGASAG